MYIYFNISFNFSIDRSMVDSGTNTDTILKEIILGEWERRRIDFSPDSHKETTQLIKDALENYPTVG